MRSRKAARRRFDVVPGEHRPSTMRTGAISLLAGAVLLYAGYTRSIPFWPEGGDVVRAEFADAANVRGGQEVRIRGVKVGTVKGVERDAARGTAIVTMRLTEDQRPELRRDARAHVYWRTLLGRNMYVELEPGRARGALGDALIPAARTTTQVELDQALEPLDDRGRAAVQVFLTTAHEGLADRTAAVGALERLGPSLRPAGPGLAALRGERPGDLQAVVDHTARVMRSLDRREGELARLVDGAAVTLGVTAARRADLADALRAAPPALARARRQSVALLGTLDRLDPLARELRPGARGLQQAVSAATPAVRAGRPVLDDADPLLADLQPAIRRLRSASRAGMPLTRKLDPTVVRARDQILPWLTSRDKRTGRQIHELVGPVASAFAALTQAYDIHGHDVPFQGGSGTRALGQLAPCEPLLLDPNADQRIRCDALAKGLGELFRARRKTR